jgi:hypothetical protein
VRPLLMTSCWDFHLSFAESLDKLSVILQLWHVLRQDINFCGKWCSIWKLIHRMTQSNWAWNCSQAVIVYHLLTVDGAMNHHLLDRLALLQFFLP